MKIHLVPGTYYAGINRPFLVTDNMIAAHLPKPLKLTGIYRRETLPATVNPKADPTYDDGWDEYLEATVDTAADITVTSRVWKWLAGPPEWQSPDGPAAPAPPKPAPTKPAPPTPARVPVSGATVLILLVAAFLATDER